jgi:hypothetical protein
MLGDMPEGWAAHPAAAEAAADSCQGQVRLWSAVRLTFLFALWCTHQDPEPAARTSHAVVATTIHQLQRQIWAQFKVAAGAEHDINALPTQLLTADLKPTELEAFESTWAYNGVLCNVDRTADGKYSLHMRLSEVHPVVAPGSGAAAAQ